MNAVNRGWTFRAAPLVVAVAVVAAGLGVPSPAAAERSLEPTAKEGAHAHPTLAASLHDDLAAGVPVHPAIERGDPEVEPAAGAPVAVVVEAADPAAARAAVEAAGGVVTVELADRVQADVPTTALLDVAEAPGVGYVREPVPVVPAVVTEGVGVTGAGAWHSGGFDGDGVKVAILDVGFGGHALRIGPAGELGNQVTTDFSRCASPGADVHGTAVAEIVHDMAPGAALHLVCIETEEDFISAVQVMDDQDVDIVNGSIGIAGVGRGDGSGALATTSAGAVRGLRAQGILYVASAGNYGQHHYHQAAVGDSPVPNGADPNLNDLVNITANDGLGFTMPGSGGGRLTLVWDQWTGPINDFDVYIYHPSCGIFAGGNSVHPPGSRPVEYVNFPRCGSNASGYEVLVDRYGGTGSPRMDFYFDGNVGAIEVRTQSSLSEPASSEAVMSVGSHCFANGALQPYSSQGPTIDGRVEPDISGPDATSTSGGQYGAANGCSGGFTGTSAAAPHVTGAAALLLGANGGLDVAELQQLVEDRAIESGTAGRDSQFGAGRLTMGSPGSASTPTPLAFTPMQPVRLYDTRAGQLGAAESPARNTPVGQGQFLQVPVRGIAGVPADAVAVSLNVTVTQPTTSGFVTVQPESTAVTTSNLNFVRSQTVAQQVTATVGSSNRVRVFNSAGNSHVIVDVTGWYGPNSAPGVPATDRFNAMAAPVRAFDSRSGQGYAESPNRTTRLTSTEEVVLDLDLPGGVPAGATAAIVNLTVTQGTTGGHITAFPADGSVPATSNLNYAAGQTVANLAVVPLDVNGQMRIRSHGSPHVIVDVIGWFQDSVGAGYVALDPPRRVLDTRTGTGLRRGAVATASPHNQIVGRYTGVPADAEAVLMGVIAVSPTHNSHLTVFPTGQALPPASTLNFAPGRTVPNAVVAGLGTQGQVRMHVGAGTAHLVADVAGYFLDPANVPVDL